MNISRALIACILSALLFSCASSKAGDTGAQRLIYSTKLAAIGFATNCGLASLCHGIAYSSSAPGYVKAGVAVGTVGTGIIANIVLAKETLLLLFEKHKSE